MTFLNETLGRRLVPDRRVMLALVIILAAAVVIGLLAAQQPLLAIVAVLAVPGLLVMIAWPDALTLATIFILYTNAAVVAVRFHGVPFIVGASVPALLIIPLANYLIVRRQGLIVNSVLLWLVLYLVIQAVGGLFSASIDTAAQELIIFVVEGVGLYFLILNTVRTPRTLRFAIWVLVIAGLFMGGLSFYQQITGSLDNNYGGFAQLGGEFGTGVEGLQGEVTAQRQGGPLGDVNRYAQILLMLMPLALFRLWGERSNLARALAALATGFIVIGATLTFSRGGTVGFVFVLVVMVFMRYIKLHHLAIVLLCLALLPQMVPHLDARLAKLEFLVDEQGGGIEAADTSVQSRVTEMLAAALVFADYPVLGVGPGMYPYYYHEYAEEVGIRVKAEYRQPHTLYLGVAAENGVLGLLCFLAIVFVTLRDLARARKRWLQNHPAFANLATGFILAIVSYLTTGIFLHFSYIRFFWLIMGLAGAASRILDAEAATTHDTDFGHPRWEDARAGGLHGRGETV